MPSLEAVVEIVTDQSPVATIQEDKAASGPIPIPISKPEPTPMENDVEIANKPTTDSAAQKPGAMISPNTPTNSSKITQQRKVSQRRMDSFFFATSTTKSPSDKDSEPNLRSDEQVKSFAPIKTSSQAGSNAEAIHGDSMLRTQIDLTEEESKVHVEKRLDFKDTGTCPTEIKSGEDVVSNTGSNFHDITLPLLQETRAAKQPPEPSNLMYLGDSATPKPDAPCKNDKSLRVPAIEGAGGCTQDTDGMAKDLQDGYSTSNLVVESTEQTQTTDVIESRTKDVLLGDTPSEIAESVSNDSPNDLAHLQEDKLKLLQKHKEMETKYSKRASELVTDARGGLDEENIEMPDPQHEVAGVSEDNDFPDCVVANMALLIEGSPLSLSKLATKVCERLQECHSVSWKIESVAAKIKLLATRKSYLPTSTEGDLFEDENEDRMWRWEVVIVELLPESSRTNIKKARVARKKLFNQYKDTAKLVSNLQDVNKAIIDKSSPNLDAFLAKLSKSEEKVLKYEREAEKMRLAEQARLRKLQEKISKQEEKEQAAEKKRKEKERKRQEAAQRKINAEKKKEEAAKTKEEAKRKKSLEREEQKKRDLEQMDKEQARLQKQRDYMMQFFVAPQKMAEDIPNEIVARENTTADSTVEGCTPGKSVDIHAVVNSTDAPADGTPLFATLSRHAVDSRKRRVGRVSVSVYVTVIPENGFEGQPFAEPRVISVRNKYKFLSFHEDCRPPYHGTWSKSSSVVTARNPFGKDDAVLDYSFNSEAEWEEGDDEIGEDVEDDDKNQDEDGEDEEGDPREYNYEDGFCIADQDYLAIDADVDEETQMLYKRKLQSSGNGSRPQQDECVPNRVCVIAPLTGGLPPYASVGGYLKSIEGFELCEASDLLETHEGKNLLTDGIYLDAFPPLLIDEGDGAHDSVPPPPKDEYSTEDLKLFVRFVHGCTLTSKEKVVEELRNQHPSVFASRAKATRKLDAIAVKQRRENAAGIYWEVKREIIVELGLQELQSRIAAEEGSKKTVSEPDEVRDAEKGSSAEATPRGGRKEVENYKKKSSGSARKKKRAPKDSAPASSKKPKVAVVQASASVMANFLQKGKTVKSSEEEGKVDSVENS